MSEKRKAYNLYLKSDHWKELRKRKFGDYAFGNNGKHCANCESSRLIHVHHINYKNLIDCDLDDLLVLCKKCHDDLHLGAKMQKINLAGIGLQIIKAIISTFRLTDEYRKREIRLAERKAVKKKPVEGKPNVYKRTSRIFRKLLRHCRLQSYSDKSIQEFILAAQQVLIDRNNEVLIKKTK